MCYNTSMSALRYIDLFCGIGGFRLGLAAAAAAHRLLADCVFAADIDPDAQQTYRANFGDQPLGDIQQLAAEAVADHDLLLAGFPCQPFSIMGKRHGFGDTRGTLFFDVARILAAKQPTAFVLENVKQLTGHDQGRTLRRMLDVLADLGYHTHYRVLNALDFGLPQKRERVFIVGTRRPVPFRWPSGGQPMRRLSDLLEAEVPPSYYASAHIQQQRQASYAGQHQEPTIWHENKAGHISAYPYSCALRAGASYNYLLVDGQRRLTERELLRLQGFPDDYRIVVGYSAMRKLTGNAVAVPVVQAVVGALLDALAAPLDYVVEQYQQSSLPLALPGVGR